VIRIYRQLFTAQFQAAAQYRIQFLLWMLFSVIRPTIFLAAWVAVARARGGSVDDFSAADFAGYYICLTLVLHLTAAWNSFEFEWQVRQGGLSPKLLRPLHPLHYAVVENQVFKIATLPPLSIVLVLLGLTFDVQLATQWWHVALFIPSIALAWGLNFMLGWVVATSAFWLQRVETLNTLLQRTSFVFAGQIAPVALMPTALQAVCYVLPFYYILGAPTEILMGAVTMDRALASLAVQAAWLTVCASLFSIFWRRGLRQYSAVGA
jgi:ABC-2 type transport system permease protein